VIVIRDHVLLEVERGWVLDSAVHFFPKNVEPLYCHDQDSGCFCYT
jgi:hypothetical protein